MPSDPAFWSAIGFWILMVGLVGDLIVIFVPSGRTEKTLATIFTVLIAIGVAVEHMADAKRFGPRTLSVAQQERIVSQLKQFAGQPFNIITYPTNKEAGDLTTLLDHVLIAAEWIGDPVPEWLGTRLIVGVEIALDPRRASELRGVAEALASILTKEQITAEVRIDPEQGTHPNDIQIRVGVKP